MSQKITWNFGVIREFLMYSADFQQISTLKPNLATNFVKFSGEVFIIKSTTHNVSKKIFFIKIYTRKPEISSIECQKTCEIERVALSMIKISPENFTNFIVKFGSKAEICWKSAEYIRNSRITLKLQVICWDIYIFSERLWCQLSNKPH